MTMDLECLVSEGLQSAMDVALPVVPITCDLVVEASTAPATLQLLLNGTRLSQQARIVKRFSIMPRNKLRDPCGARFRGLNLRAAFPETSCLDRCSSILGISCIFAVMSSCWELRKECLP